jgi:prefoldin subunit 5
MNEEFSVMHAHIQALEAQSCGLQALVCELLQKNQELRAALATFRQANRAANDLTA